MRRTGCVGRLDALARRAKPRRKMCPTLDANEPERTVYVGRMRRSCPNEPHTPTKTVPGWAAAAIIFPRPETPCYTLLIVA
jgi:hypothetical protein